MLWPLENIRFRVNKNGEKTMNADERFKGPVLLNHQLIDHVS